MLKKQLALGLIIFCVTFVVASPVYAASALRTTGGTAIDSINSLTVIDRFVTKPVALGTQKAVVFGITFRITAFEDAIRIPLHVHSSTPEDKVGLGSSDTSSSQMKLALDSRYASTKNTPLLLASLVPKDTSNPDMLTIAPGSTGEVTLLIAYAGTPDPDREDRVLTLSLPMYFGSSTAPLSLNQHELGDLVTLPVELGM